MKQQKGSSFFKKGGWRIFLCVLLLCLVVVSGIIFGALGSRARVDLTKNNVFTLSDSTYTLLNGLESNINIMLVQGVDSTDARLNELVERYDAASDHVSADVISAETSAYYVGAELDVGSIIVTNGEHRVVLQYSDLYEIEYAKQGYYQTLNDYSLAAEDRINKAIVNVNADLPIAYYLSGHGESAAEIGMEALLSEAGFHTSTLYLNEISSVPEDCALIICIAPQMDLLQKEADMLIDYIDKGGSFLLVTDMKYPFESQLERVTEHTGLAMVSGVIMEGDESYMYDKDYPYYMLSEVNADAFKQIAPDAIVPSQALIAIAHAIDLKDNADYVQYALMSTSELAYLKPDAYTDGNMEYADGDRHGPFIVAAAAENENGGKLVWISGERCLTDAIDEMVDGANYTCASVIAEWMHGDKPVPTAVDIEPVSVMTPQLSIEPPVFFIGLCGAVPVIILLIGAIMSVKRHKYSVSERTK